MEHPRECIIRVTAGVGGRAVRCEDDKGGSAHSLEGALFGHGKV